MLPSRGDECRASASQAEPSRRSGWPLQRAARVAALGASLGALAVGLGGRVGFLGVNSLAHVECWLGVPALGRVMVDLNFRLAEPELALMVDDSAGLGGSAARPSAKSSSMPPATARRTARRPPAQRSSTVDIGQATQATPMATATSTSSTG